jgi:hypothetical protein
MFDLKKFIALIGTDEVLMELFYLHADAIGIEPNFDIYHVLEGKEIPNDTELEIMKKMYHENILGTKYEIEYYTADVDFTERLAEKNKRRRENLKK